ncbi:MAG: alcohol dehydrogenase catalytic domain-containing protein [Chloroflexi bacterium]|nr:alcohol dehydrogenase catalytic domain-containing protein [Chloroflexota bacterium]
MSTRMMRAARLHGDRRVTVEDRPIPVPAANQVLLQMKAAGICGSDLHSFRLPEPEPNVRDFVPGHEPCGVVVEVGDAVTDWKVGDRVVVYHRCTCKKCHYCRTGFRNWCPNRNMRGRRAYGFNPDGGDEEYMAADADDLMRLPDQLDFVEGAVLACQTGTAYYGLKNIDTRAGDRVLVTGLGPVGLLATLLAKAMGAEVIGADPLAERRRIAGELGADAVFDPAAAPLADQVKSLWPDGATRWAEASGAAAAHAAIPAAAAMNARVAIIGGGAREPSLVLTALMGKQICVIGSNLWPFTAWDEITDFVIRKRVPIRRVVTHELSIDDAPLGFALADRGAAGKVVFRFSH